MSGDDVTSRRCPDGHLRTRLRRRFGPRSFRPAVAQAQAVVNRWWACATRALLLVLGLMFGAGALALTPEQALRLVDGGSDDRIEAMSQAVPQGDAALRAFLEAVLADGVKVHDGRVYVLRGDAYVLAGTDETAEPPDEAEDVVNNNRMRGELEAAIAALSLLADDRATRAAAIDALRGRPDAARLPLVERAIASEQDPRLREGLLRLQDMMRLWAADRTLRLDAARALANSADPAIRASLLQRLAEEPDALVRAELQRAADAVRERLAWGERLGVLFTGLSLGSILMLAALGLAITYGLMGVINMAHGELIMIGAYATYVVQGLFRQHAPQWFDAYVLAAIPASFACAALVGAVLERSVIRWLYGRPLETLLATWGISLILMQAVRSIFGAQNVAVENPSWLSGGWELLPNLTLPWNRVAILVFAAAVLAGVALVIARTRLGLFVRGVTQNRRMAACVGVHTARVDTWAFALGAGIAGLAGCALSQVGNVGPDLGQAYIVDSFMVVVLGGVGQLAGTVYAGLGLGVLNKVLEGWQGAVLAKIMVLIFIVAFIQKRPQGLFALKGRSAEA